MFGRKCDELTCSFIRAFFFEVSVFAATSIAFFVVHW